MGKIYGKEDSQFEPVSIDIHDAVCAEAVDLGMQDGPYGRKHQGMLVFQVKEKIEEGEYEGQRKEVRLYHTMTLGTDTWPSKIRKFVEKWRGKKFTQEEVEAGFDTEVLVGMACRLDVNHRTNKEGSRTYAVIDSVSKASDKDMEVDSYTPIAERQSKDKKNDDDDIPF